MRKETCFKNIYIIYTLYINVIKLNQSFTCTPMAIGSSVPTVSKTNILLTCLLTRDHIVHLLNSSNQ